MMDAATVFAGLEQTYAEDSAVESGQMFGKACLKVGGKAFVARQNDVLAFKLAGDDHEKALGAGTSCLWDPSGKSRPMKEWVAVPVTADADFAQFAQAAYDYVRQI